MKKTLLIPSLIFGLIILATSQVTALGIEVNERGVANFYSTSVLGKNTQQGSQPQQEAIKRINPQSGQRMMVHPEDGQVSVQMLRRDDDDWQAQKFTQTEQVNDRQVQMEFPVAPKAPANPVRDELRAKHQEQVMEEEGEGYLERIQQQRMERAEERVQLHSELNDQGQVQLRMKVDNASAKINQGAVFTLDPETNQVYLTTPSGNEHVLNHLPDQAIERMQDAGLFNSKGDVEISVDGDGIQYRLPTTVQKRLLGLFPRQQQAETILDDSTGEISQEILPAKNFVGRLLNVLSF